MRASRHVGTRVACYGGQCCARDSRPIERPSLSGRQGVASLLLYLLLAPVDLCFRRRLSGEAVHLPGERPWTASQSRHVTYRLSIRTPSHPTRQLIRRPGPFKSTTAAGQGDHPCPCREWPSDGAVGEVTARSGDFLRTFVQTAQASLARVTPRPIDAVIRVIDRANAVAQLTFDVLWAVNDGAGRGSFSQEAKWI
jgi:hypothetical protein